MLCWTAEAIVGAVEWVYKVVKTPVMDVIHFIEFLFEWDDIRRTKDVLHNIFRFWLQDQVDGIPKAKAAVDGKISGLGQALNQWAGITDWSGIGSVAKEPAADSASNPAKGQTSGSQLLASHFQNHVRELSIVGDSPTFSATDDVVNDLLKAISNEGNVLGAVYTQLKELAGKFGSMSVEDVLKHLAVILVDGVLSSAQVVVDALLDVLHDMASAAVTLLDTKIHIPVISDILNGIDVPDISFLDLITWIAAVGYTVVYKTVENKPPFPDDEHVRAIISATSWGQPTEMFLGPSSISIPAYLQNIIFISGHFIAGYLTLTVNLVTTLEAEAETGENPFSTPSSVIGIIIAASQGASDELVPKDDVENGAVSTVSTITTAAGIVSSLLFSGFVQKKFGASGSKFAPLVVNDGRATGAIVDSILVIPALVVSGWHFYELNGKPAGATRSAAIVGEVSNLASCVSRVAYAAAVNDKDPETKQIPVGIMVVSNVAVAGLQAAEAAIN